MNTPDPVTLAAYGQIWHFSSDSLAALKQFGMGAPATLTNLIIQLSPTDGFQDGDYYEVDYQGVGLSINVQGDKVSVDTLKKNQLRNFPKTALQFSERYFIHWTSPHKSTPSPAEKKQTTRTRQYGSLRRKEAMATAINAIIRRFPGLIGSH